MSSRRGRSQIACMRCRSAKRRCDDQERCIQCLLHNDQCIRVPVGEEGSASSYSYLGGNFRPPNPTGYIGSSPSLQGPLELLPPALEQSVFPTDPMSGRTEVYTATAIPAVHLPSRSVSYHPHLSHRPLFPEPNSVLPPAPPVAQYLYDQSSWNPTLGELNHPQELYRGGVAESSNLWHQQNDNWGVEPYHAPADTSGHLQRQPSASLNEPQGFVHPPTPYVNTNPENITEDSNLHDYGQASKTSVSTDSPGGQFYQQNGSMENFTQDLCLCLEFRNCEFCLAKESGHTQAPDSSYTS